MILLTESPPDLDPDKLDGDIVGQTKAALEAGFEVAFIPLGRVLQEGDDPVHDVPHHEAPAEALWIGHIPSRERYEAVFRGALAKNVRLLNDPETHLRITEFDRWYPRLEGLTPRSCVVRSVDEVDAALAQVGLPAFIKGAVLSKKSFGWKAVVAESVDDARKKVENLLKMRTFSRGMAALRALVPLRKVGHSVEGFPLSREYRVFVLRGTVVGSGYYWMFGEPFGPPAGDEWARITELAREAAARLEAPWLSVDLAQTEAGEWLIIEVGDPQFSGVSHMSIQELWSTLASELQRRSG